MWVVGVGKYEFGTTMRTNTICSGNDRCGQKNIFNSVVVCEILEVSLLLLLLMLLVFWSREEKG